MNHNHTPTGFFKTLKVLTSSTCIRCIIILFIFFGCAGEKKSGTIVARVGNRTLSLEDVAEFALSEGAEPISTEEKREFIRQWIDTEVLYRQALREKLHKDERIQRTIAQMEKELLAAELMERRIGHTMAIANSEIEEYYLQHHEEFILTKPHVRIRHILVDSSEKAREIRDRVVAGDPFEELVLEASLDTETIASGGDLGIVSEEDIDPAIAEKAFSMEVGDISEPIQTEWGYHIIQVTDSKPAGSMLSLEDVKEEIANKVFATKQRFAFDTLMKELKEHEQIEVYWDRIESETESDEGVESTH